MAPPVPAEPAAPAPAAKAGDGAPSGDAAPKPDAAPAPVEYKFTAPEGVTLDQGLLDQFTPLAKEMGLKPEQAQQLVNLYAKAQQDAAKAYEQSVQQMEAGWRDAMKNDPVYGGPKYEATVADAKKAVARFEAEIRDPSTPDATPLKDFFNETGVGSHPVMVKLMASIGRKIAEDRPVGSTSSSAAELTLADKLYSK